MWETGRSGTQVFVRESTIKYQSFDEDVFDAYFVGTESKGKEQPSVYAKLGLKWEILHKPEPKQEQK